MAGTLTIDTLKASSGVLATQNGMSGIAKAWVNFNGTSGASPVIRGSFNISSVVRNGTGDYTVNFTTAMSDANYSTVTGTSFYALSSSGASYAYNGSPRNATTTSVKIYGGNTSSGASSDLEVVNVSVFSA